MEHRQQSPSHRDEMPSGGWKGFGREREKVHFVGIPDTAQEGAGPEGQEWKKVAARLRFWGKQLHGQRHPEADAQIWQIPQHCS